MNIITLKILFANENLNINTHPIYYPYLIIEITKLIKLFFFSLNHKGKTISLCPSETWFRFRK